MLARQIEVLLRQAAFLPAQSWQNFAFEPTFSSFTEDFACQEELLFGQWSPRLELEPQESAPLFGLASA